MGYLEDRTKADLFQISARPQEKLGQHFLVDEDALDQISGRVIRGAHVVEIGAGTGNLTRALAERAGSVAAVEIDDRYLPLLGQVQNEFPNVQVWSGDAIQIGLKRLLDPDGLNQLISNLPYNLTEPFMAAAIAQNIHNLILLLGDNATRLMTEQEGSPSFSRLSLLAQTFFEVSVLRTLPKTSFYPQPRTESNLIELVPREDGEIKATPSGAIFYRLFMTMTQSPLVVNVIKEALQEHALTSGANTLDKRQAWQRNRSQVKRETRRLMQEWNSTGELNLEEENSPERGVLTEETMMRLVSQCMLSDSVLRKPFIKLDNPDIRRLVGGIRTVFN